jgi:large subunit ribosomal protein L4
VVFGPHPRDYSKKVTKSVRRLALRKALSTRIQAGDVFIVDSFAVSQPKTKDFVASVQGITGEERRVLIVGAIFDDTTYLSARNVQPTQLATASDVNTEQLLAYRKIIITNDALSQLAERTSK